MRVKSIVWAVVACMTQRGQKEDLKRTAQHAIAAGLGALFAPYLSLIRPTHAQTELGPAKYLFIFFSNGTEPSVWSPRGSTASSLVHSQMTEPLAPLDDNLVLVEKLELIPNAAR